MLSLSEGYQKKSLFIIGACGNLKSVGVMPQVLRLEKVDTCSELQIDSFQILDVPINLKIIGCNDLIRYSKRLKLLNFRDFN